MARGWRGGLRGVAQPLVREAMPRQLALLLQRGCCVALLLLAAGGWAAGAEDAAAGDTDGTTGNMCAAGFVDIDGSTSVDDDVSEETALEEAEEDIAAVSQPYRCIFFVLLYMVEGLLLCVGIFGRGRTALVSAALSHAAAAVHARRGRSIDASIDITFYRLLYASERTLICALFAAGMFALGLMQRLVLGEACYGWCGVPVVMVPDVAGDVMFSVFIILSVVLLWARRQNYTEVRRRLECCHVVRCLLTHVRWVSCTPTGDVGAVQSLLRREATI